MSAQAASHGLQYHARAIASQIDSSGSSRWLAGTTVVSEENEIQLLQLDAEKDRLSVQRTFTHPKEIWSILPSPSHPSQFATTHTEGRGIGASLWSFSSEGRDLKEEASISGSSDDVKGAAWSSANGSSIGVISAKALKVCKIAEGEVKVLQQSELQSQAGPSGAIAWSKRDGSQLGISSGNDIQIWDLRDWKVAASVGEAHSSTIRCLDFANGDSNCIASSGDDCRVKLWDKRLLKNPLMELSDHAHWVWQCKFNPSHDQLLLSSSSDATVQLHHIPKLGKAAPKAAPASFPGLSQWQGTEASKAAVYDGHDDSVYGIAWSTTDPWVFASMSYDGRVMVGRIPSNVKYSILI